MISIYKLYSMYKLINIIYFYKNKHKIN